MSIYHNRTEPAYRPFKSNPHDARNRHILKWWTSTHDHLMADTISRWQWSWHREIVEQVVRNTGQDIIEAWKRTDPLCHKQAWNNILMRFAVSRGEQLGLTRHIRQPRWKECRLCAHSFVEDSLPHPLIIRLGMDGLDFCAPCLQDTLLREGRNSTNPKEILAYLQSLSTLIQRVPPQNFGTGVSDLMGLDNRERLALLKLMKIKPSPKRVKSVFGSWLNALIRAGILEDGTLRTNRGTRCIAKDGHVCLSLAEKTIDDQLYSLGIAHEKEPHYPGSNYRADFEVGGCFIEYFGLTGDLDYDIKTQNKINLCKQLGIRLIAIYPEDLVNLPKLEQKLSALLATS